MSESHDLTYYISIASGALLTISEFLPYISQVKGNSIVQVLLNACSKLNQARNDSGINREQDRLEEQIAELTKQVEELKSQIRNIQPPTQPPGLS